MSEAKVVNSYYDRFKDDFYDNTEDILQQFDFVVSHALNDNEKALIESLSIKQLLFVKYVVAGYPEYKAYNKAYDTNKRSVSPANKYLSTNYDKVKKLIEVLKQKVLYTGLLTREHKRKILARIATSKYATPLEKIAAIRVDNKLAGHDEVMNTSWDADFNRLYEQLQPTLKVSIGEGIINV